LARARARELGGFCHALVLDIRFDHVGRADAFAVETRKLDS
jgi:hypothetical protein